MATSRLMRAVRVAQFGGPDVLKVLSDVPVPKPKESQVLIKVSAAGVNPVDTYIRSGNYSSLPSLPYTPGMDVAGTVEEVGKSVTKLKPGDRVYTVRTISGGYAEFCVAEEMHTFKLHQSLTFQQGAAVGIPYFTAYRALIIRAQAKPGEFVLIHGASGGVGTAACQLAHAYGMRVLGTAGSPEGLDLVLKNKAEQAFNHNEKKYCDQIMEFTEGRGVDVIIEMLSNVNLQKDLELLGRKGRVIILGSRGSIKIDPRATMGKESDIRGVALMTSSPEDFAEMGAAMASGQEVGWLKPVIGKEFSLDEIKQTHTEIMSTKRAAHGKIVLKL